MQGVQALQDRLRRLTSVQAVAWQKRLLRPEEMSKLLQQAWRIEEVPADAVTPCWLAWYYGLVTSPTELSQLTPDIMKQLKFNLHPDKVWRLILLRCYQHHISYTGSCLVQHPDQFEAFTKLFQTSQQSSLVSQVNSRSVRQFTAVATLISNKAEQEREALSRSNMELQEACSKAMEVNRADVACVVVAPHRQRQELIQL